MDVRDQKLVLKNIKQHYAGKFYDPGKGSSIYFHQREKHLGEVALKLGLSKQSIPRFTTGVVLSVVGFIGGIMILACGNGYESRRMTMVPDRESQDPDAERTSETPLVGHQAWIHRRVSKIYPIR